MFVDTAKSYIVLCLWRLLVKLHSYKFHLTTLLMLVQVMARCLQATIHYLKQCWPRSIPSYGVTGAQWIKCPQGPGLTQGFALPTFPRNKINVHVLSGHNSYISTVYSGADQRKHQSSASLAFVRGIHRWPVNSPHKGPVTRKYFHLITSSCYMSRQIKVMFLVNMILTQAQALSNMILGSVRLIYRPKICKQIKG